MFFDLRGSRRARAAAAAAPVTLRFRQVHLDFHTAPQVDGIGADFDPVQFAHTLKRAHVDSVTVFARDHHGYLYFPSKRFPERIHPHLARKNLLGDQIAACHKVGIRAPIYTTVQWDQVTCDAHTEWRQVTGTGALEGSPEPGFQHRLCLNSPYRDFLKAHVEEIFDLLPVDGLFLDIVSNQDCSCVNCRAGMKKRGLDPSKIDARKAFGADVVDSWKRDMTNVIRRKSTGGTIFYNAGNVGPNIRPGLSAYTHLEIESLPSGNWGYLHFPLTMRYARTLGKDALGMTGKFHTSWGDFHSLKNPAALQFECFLMLALGAKCSVGDQLHPSGKLDPATYDLIGSVYAEVEKKEPWCRGAVAQTDIGVLHPEEWPKQVERTSLPSRGVVRVLQELGHQFDMIASDADFSRYRVLILPDMIRVDGTLADKISRYLKSGGAVLASNKSAEGREISDLLGLSVKGPAPFSPDYILPRPALAAGMPPGELVMYRSALELVPAGNTKVLADVVTPYFNRTFEHYFSHKQAPSTGQMGYPAVLQKDRAITFAHPVFTQYTINAPSWVKRLVKNALDILLPSPLLRHTGPSTVVAAVNAQPAEKRTVVHLLHYIPERRGEEMDTIEDVIPTGEITVSLRADKAPARVTMVPQGSPVPFKYVGSRIEIKVPTVNGHVVLEIA